MRNGRNGSPDNEKPKNFSEAIIKLARSLKDFKVLIILAVTLAGLSSIFSLVAPNKLSDLTDEISKGLIINTSNMEKLQNDLMANIDKDNLPVLMSDIIDMKFDESTMEKVMSADISNADKATFKSIVTIMSEDSANAYKYISEIPESALNILLTDSVYNDVNVSSEDKINLITNMKSFDYNNNDYSFISKLPNSINEILFPTSTIDGIEITTKDKVSFINKITMVDEDTSVNDMYAMIGKLPSSIQKLINPKMNMKTIKKIALVLVIIYLFSSIFSYIEGLSMIKVANNYAKKLRKSISIKINKLPLKFFDRSLKGDILSRVTNDVDTISSSLNQTLTTIVSSITMFIGCLIMMFITNYIMAFTAIIASIIGFSLMGLILGKSQKYFNERQKELGNLNGYIEEVYSGLTVVKTCNAKDEVNKEFDKLNNKLFECNRKSQFLSGLMHPIMHFVGNLGYVAVCVVGALLVANDKTTFGVIVAFIMYVRLFTNPLTQIAQSMTSLQSTAAASERVFDFLEEEEMSDQKDIVKYLDKDKVKGKIEFKNVKFGYNDDKIIIKKFNAVAKPGQKIAIVGPTGAGKTTMVNLLMKFYEINSGDIIIDGTSIKDLSRENIHDLFTMVLQDTWLFNGTVKENIAYNRKNVSDKRIKEVCKTVGIDHFIKTLPNGYDSVLSDNDSVSAGQRQLLTIARGMIEDAPFLILDEATSNVDTRTEELVQKAMDKLMENRTSFIIAHRLSTIKNADLILVMKEGNIIETGNHNDLMKKNGFYAKLYNSQFEKVTD